MWRAQQARGVARIKPRIEPLDLFPHEQAVRQSDDRLFTPLRGPLPDDEQRPRQWNVTDAETPSRAGIALLEHGHGCIVIDVVHARVLSKLGHLAP